MTYKIAYRKDFNKEGYCYRQRLTCTLSNEEFVNVNKALKEAFRDGYWFAKQLVEGYNYTNITTADIFVKYFGIDDKRYIDWANTVINIKIN